MLLGLKYQGHFYIRCRYNGLLYTGTTSPQMQLLQKMGELCRNKNSITDNTSVIMSNTVQDSSY